MKQERYVLRFTMQAQGDEAEVMIYSDIANEKWWGDESTPTDFDKALKEARKGGANRLNVRVNSGGGEVYAAVAMRSMVINAGFEDVRVMIEGLCASAATLFATIPGARVVIAEGSEFMIHNPMTMAWGNAAALSKTVDHLHKMEEQFGQMYAQRCGQDEDTVRAWMDAETWFTAKEAVEAGFCDELLEAEPVAACVTAREMGVMRSLYAHVPEGIRVQNVECEEHTSSVTAGAVPPSPQGEGFGVPHRPFGPPPHCDGEAFGGDLSPAFGGGLEGRRYRSDGEAPGDETENRPLSSDVSDGEPASGAGDPTEIHTQEDDLHMEIREITMDQLRAENPALLEQIRQEAVCEERARIEDIDALTLPGYEAMAEDAKANGMSAMDFQRAVVTAQKQRGREFIESRKLETAPSAEVKGGSALDDRSEAQQIEDAAKEIAAYAQGFSGNNNEGMF